MILFAADNHYGVHPGKNAYDKIRADYPEMIFAEDDWSIFSSENFAKSKLVILNMIGGTCNIPLPSDEACDGMLEYCRSGRPLLLLHGASSAFWHQSWWRSNCGLRWVRPGDPDNITPSTHPVEPYRVTPSKTRHELCKLLQEMDLPKDEIYTELEQTTPLWTIMHTDVCNRTFPQCTVSQNEWGGTVVNFLPGHHPEVTGGDSYIGNLRILIDWLLKNN